MRIDLKPKTVDRIEAITGQKMTTRCDRMISKALDKVEGKEQTIADASSPQVKMSANIMELLQDG